MDRSVAFLADSEICLKNHNEFKELSKMASPRGVENRNYLFDLKELSRIQSV